MTNHPRQNETLAKDPRPAAARAIPLPANLADLRATAWIGDAVLALYVRGWILDQQGRMNGGLFSRCTSNEFLLRLGDPTKVEATIGVVYQAEGLEAARRWLDHHLLQHLQREAAGGGRS